MAKDYAKFVPPKKRTQSKGSAYFFIFLFALVIAAAGGYILLVKSHNPRLSNFLSALTHKKNSVLSAKTPPKKLAQAKPTKPEVQFDFYSELPNMQMTLSEPGAAVKGLTQIKTAAMLKPVLPADSPVSAAAKQPDIFNTEELSTLLEAETQTAQSRAPHYVIQFGVFESEAAAQRLLQAINSVGFEGNIVKSQHEGQQFYRVQQGPYETKELAKLTQQQLQKRGIISIIRKAA